MPAVECVPQSFPGGKAVRGVALTTHQHLAPKVKEEVELYLYSPSGPTWRGLG